MAEGRGLRAIANLRKSDKLMFVIQRYTFRSSTPPSAYVRNAVSSVRNLRTIFRTRGAIIYTQYKRLQAVLSIGHIKLHMLIGRYNNAKRTLPKERPIL